MKKNLLFILKTLGMIVLLASVIGIASCRSKTTDIDAEPTVVRILSTALIFDTWLPIQLRYRMEMAVPWSFTPS
jgi:hypothetical protein